MANFTSTSAEQKKKSTLNSKDTSYASSTAKDSSTAYQNAASAQSNADSAYNSFVNAYNNRSQLSEYQANVDVENLYNQIMNQKDFSYDFNADQTYKNLAESYTKQGQMAMKDTMGQAAALNGGNSTSYSQMAGQQVYNKYMQELADYIPELEEKAYSRYQDKIAQLYNQYNTAVSRDDTAYSRYADAVGQEYDDINTLYGLWADMQSQANTDRTYASGLASEERDAYEYDTSLAYQKERDAVSDSQWQTEFDYAKEQDAIANALAKKNYELNAAAAAQSSSDADREFAAYLAANGLISDGNGGYIVNTNDPNYQAGLLDSGYKLDENGNVVVDWSNVDRQVYLQENGLKLDENGSIVIDEGSPVYTDEGEQPSFGNIKTAAKQLYQNNGQNDWLGLTTAVEYVAKFDLTDDEADQIAISIGYNTWDEMAADYAAVTDYHNGGTANIPNVKYYG